MTALEIGQVVRRWGSTAEPPAALWRIGVLGLTVAGGIAVAATGWPGLAGATTVTPRPTSTAAATEVPGIDASPTSTPTATATPQRTGDLGTREITGEVYDTERGIDAGIVGATVSYSAPGGSGTVQTDSRGAYAFSLFLHDTDLVTVRAAAPGFQASEVRLTGLQVWFQAVIDLGLEPVERTTHRVAGRVRRDPYCSAESRVTVVLEPVGGGDRSGATLLSPSNEFLFEDVPDGDYTVGAESECQPSYAAPVPVYVRGADAYSEIAFDATCPPVLAIEPDRGPPGTVVELRGRCYYIHSGGSAELSLDGERITSVRGGTSGHYETQVLIPADAPVGLHSFGVTTTGGMLIGSASFLVEEGATACIGDCNGDARVEIAELVTGVRIAAGAAGAECAGLATREGDGLIAQLVAAVANALNGCAA